METIILQETTEIGEVKLICSDSTSDNAYQDCLFVRKACYAKVEEYAKHLEEIAVDSDKYSDIYVLYVNGLPVGTVAATYFKKGFVDCQQFYPKSLIDACFEEIASANKLAVSLRAKIDSLPLTVYLIKNCWIDVIKKGVTIDIINVSESMIPFYEKLGYTLIPDHSFTHPVFGNQSQVMFNCTDPEQNSPLAETFKGAARQISKQAVLALATKAYAKF